MGGGNWREGHPHPHPLTSYWQLPFSEIANHRSTPTLPSTADYVIIGTGISGASIATKLLSAVPSASIILLEARTVCSGATGRNGGHCSAGFWTRFKKDLDELGLKEAIKCERWELENVKNLAAFIKNNAIDCDLEEVDRVDYWQEEDEFAEHVEILRARQDALPEEDQGLESARSELDSGKKDLVEDVGGKEVFYGAAASEFLKVPNIAGAVVYRGYTLSPYKLVNEMVRRLLRQGVNLQTTTPVISIDKIHRTARQKQPDRRWSVETERGIIQARNVVLATNAYTGALYPALTTKKFLIPTRAQAVAIRPGSHVLHEPRIHKALGPNGGGLGDYMMQRPIGSEGAGDIVYGGGRLLSKTGEQWTFDDSVVNPEIAEYLTNAPTKFYGREGWGENGRLLRSWTGIMGYTKDERPLCGPFNGDFQAGGWASIGFNGHGMALTFQAAQALVDMMTTGKEPDWFPKGFRFARVDS